LHIRGRQLPARGCLQLPSRCRLQRSATDDALDRAPCDNAPDGPAGDRASNGPASDRSFDRAPGGCASDGAACRCALGDSANRRCLHRAASVTTAQFARPDRAFDSSRCRGPMIGHQLPPKAVLTLQG